jgi:hypothetical protein
LSITAADNGKPIGKMPPGDLIGLLFDGDDELTSMDVPVLRPSLVLTEASAKTDALRLSLVSPASSDSPEDRAPEQSINKLVKRKPSSMALSDN